MDLYNEHNVKCKQLLLEFELQSPIPNSENVTLSVPCMMVSVVHIESLSADLFYLTIFSQWTYTLEIFFFLSQILDKAIMTWFVSFASANGRHIHHPKFRLYWKLIYYIGRFDNICVRDGLFSFSFSNHIVET